MDLNSLKEKKLNYIISMAIIATGKTRTFLQFIEAVTTMYTWATVGKTKDIRKPSAVKIARSDFTERGERLYSPSTLPTGYICIKYKFRFGLNTVLINFYCVTDYQGFITWFSCSFKQGICFLGYPVLPISLRFGFYLWVNNVLRCNLIDIFPMSITVGVRKQFVLPWIRP